MLNQLETALLTTQAYGNLVEPTVDPNLLKQGSTKERLLFVADNCERAADAISKLGPFKFKQRKWIESSWCGTRGCALGTAILSGILPGVTVKIIEGKGYPLINGLPDITGNRWRAIGTQYFGPEIWTSIFSNGNLSKREVMRGLRAWGMACRAYADNNHINFST